MTFESIVTKDEIAQNKQFLIIVVCGKGFQNKQFLLLPQCFQLYLIVELIY